jgi:hypothetical protein
MGLGRLGLELEGATEESLDPVAPIREAEAGLGKDREGGTAGRVELEGAAHQVWVDRPEVLTAIREFFEGVWPVEAESL